jgi:hypothetical protein
METKNYPPSVILTMVVLSFTALVSSQYVSLAFDKWAGLTSEPFPIAALLYGVGLCLLPVLAITDILNAKLFGRYLALFSMMILLGLILRVVSYQVAMPFSRPSAIIWATAMHSTLCVLIGLISLIYRFGFGKKANEFFGQLEI